MRMIVAGGGTGGHLFPGLAVAECALRDAGNAVLFVGSSIGIEARVIPQTRFPFRALGIRGVRGRGWRGVLQLVLQLPIAVARARAILAEFEPDVVVGVGGYASFPVVLAAWLRGVPSVLLEQNAHPGLANRVLSRLARRICTMFPDTRGYFAKEKVVVTGNPVRALPAREKASGAFTLLVFGGSQGAHRINEALFEAAARLRAELPDLRVIHQTGESDCERLRRRYAEVGLTADVRPFIEDMGWAYGEADLIVCRAGATTLAEITALGKAAILVPYPFAADDHQRANAAELESRGAAVMILDRDLTGERVAAAVRELAQDRERLRRMAEAARRMGVPEAAARVVEVCRHIAEEVRRNG